MSSQHKPYEITQMEVSHVPAVRKIDQAVYPRHWTRAIYLQELRQPHNRIYLVATQEETVIGYIGLIALADEGHISSVAVDPASQTRGIGTALMMAMHQAVRDQCLPDGKPAAIGKITDMTLEVRASNKAAQNLYAKFGYAPVGVRANYYRGLPGQGREDALVMWCHDVTSEEHKQRLQSIAAKTLLDETLLDETLLATNLPPQSSTPQKTPL